jgi:hypothetical protein
VLLFMLQPDGKPSVAVRAAVRALRKTVEAATLVAAMTEAPAAEEAKRNKEPVPAK